MVAEGTLDSLHGSMLREGDEDIATTMDGKEVRTLGIWLGVL
jgi:hypothetical protein